MKSVVEPGVVLALAALAASVLASGGCSDNAAGVLPDSGLVDSQTAPRSDSSAMAPLEWGPCPEHYRSECAHVEVPLDWDDSAAASIKLLLARHRSGKPNAAQLWLLYGGPGGAGADFERWGIEALASRFNADIYVLDHRGTGHSSRLGCDDSGQVSQKDWPACVQKVKTQWGARLEDFNVTQAARDVGHLIQRLRQSGQRVFIYGVSYGTYWALRYLQLYPDQASAVVLDAVLSPGVEFVSRFDAYFDPVGKQLLELCGGDSVCSAKLGSNPIERLTSLYQKVDKGHCSTLLGVHGRQTLRRLLAYLLADRDGRVFVMPFIYRLERCAAADRTALMNLLSFFTKSLPGDELYSPVLNAHIVLSELWEKPPLSLAEYQTIADQALFAPDAGPLLRPLYDNWPRYPADKLTWSWPSSSVPLLMLNGSLDPRTPLPLAKAAGDHLKAANQNFVTIPWAAHVTFKPSRFAATDYVPCAQRIAQSFLANPKSPPDTSCLAEQQPPSWNVPADTVTSIMQVPDMWESPP